MPNEAQNVMSVVLAWFGGFLLAGGGLAGCVFLIFRVLGEKWLNAKFEERLAAYKHAQQKELEQLKFEINTLMDRTVKLHQKEFDVLPEAWGRLTDAYGITTALTSALQQYPDLDQMTDTQLEEFLKNKTLAKWQVEELLSSSKKTIYYSKIINWDRTINAQRSLSEFHIYILKNGIFIPEPMKTKFAELDRIIQNTLTEHEINQQENIIPRLQDALKILRVKGDEILKSLEKDVQGRLWKSEALQL